MQALYALLLEESMKLPHCIAISGFVCILFAIVVPHLSALQAWLVFSTFLSLVYIVTACVLVLKDGIAISLPRLLHLVHVLFILKLGFKKELFLCGSDHKAITT